MSKSSKREQKIVCEYLRSYAAHYIPASALRLGCRVVSVDSDEQDLSSWTIGFEDAAGTRHDEVFDFVAVCTGNFSQQYIPHVEQLSRFKGDALHLVDYVGEKLFPPDQPVDKKRTILIVGGTLSATELAADAALWTASLPKEQRSHVEVLHLFSQPYWIFPKKLPFPNPAAPASPILVLQIGRASCRERV